VTADIDRLRDELEAVNQSHRVVSTARDQERGASLERRSEVDRLRMGLWDAWVALGHDTDGDTGPGALIAGMGVDGFIAMVIRDAATWRKESEDDYANDTDRLEVRAREAEAKVARVEALALYGPAYEGQSETDPYHVLLEDLRAALSGPV
jgi:hypothetical protein